MLLLVKGRGSPRPLTLTGYGLGLNVADMAGWAGRRVVAISGGRFGTKTCWAMHEATPPPYVRDSSMTQPIQFCVMACDTTAATRMQAMMRTWQLVPEWLTQHGVLPSLLSMCSRRHLGGYLSWCS